jgi:hypothetical protein
MLENTDMQSGTWVRRIECAPNLPDVARRDSGAEPFLPVL